MWIQPIAFKRYGFVVLPYFYLWQQQLKSTVWKIRCHLDGDWRYWKLRWRVLLMFQEQRSLSFIKEDGVNKVQELQMTTQTGDNTHVITIDGNLYQAQCQTHVFNDDGAPWVAANRCNSHQPTLWTLAVWCLRYSITMHAYAQLVKDRPNRPGEKSQLYRPNRNRKYLGSFLYKQISLQWKWSVRQMKACLDRLLQNTVYDKETWGSGTTTSPSMDILKVSSALERLIFHLVGNDATKRLKSWWEEASLQQVSTSCPAQWCRHLGICCGCIRR